MFHDSWRKPGRRLLSGASAIGQGLLGVALIALAALAFMPDAHAAAPGGVKKGDVASPDDAPVPGAVG
jgi:hypothetical protein